MIYHSKEEGNLDKSFDPHPLLRFFFTQNFQRPGLLWLGVNETGLTPLREPMPKFFSGSDLVFLCRGWGCYLHDSFISIIHSISLLYMSKWSDFLAPILLRWKTVLKYVYPQKWTCTPKWKYQGVHVPPNRNMSGHAATRWCYIPNIKALGLMVSDKKIFSCFTHTSLCKPCDPWGGAIFDPRGIIWTNLVEVH